MVAWLGVGDFNIQGCVSQLIDDPARTSSGWKRLFRTGNNYKQADHTLKNFVIR